MKFSKYVRQGKKTFRFGTTCGGAYGASIGYEYGYFKGNRFDGLRYSYQSYTEMESDDDEKDGIGSMTTVRKRDAWLGTFIDGKKHGFCAKVMTINSKDATDKVYFEMDEGFTLEETIKRFQEKGECVRGEDGAEFCFLEDSCLIYQNGELVLAAQTYEEGETSFNLSVDGGNINGTAFFKDGEEDPFLFDEWEEMPVDPVEEDGFSVLREMDFFRDNNCRYTITEGLFAGGKLNGLGIVYYDSYTNGFHREREKVGVFKDGELLFGYKSSYESGGRGKKTFGYADERAIEQYGEEIVYEGNRYIGEAVDGVPNGIGCLFVSEEKMLKGTFKKGKLHGVGVTYKYLDGKWTPYDFEIEKKDEDFYKDSYNMYAEGEVVKDMSWEEFYDKYEQVKKV